MQQQQQAQQQQQLQQQLRIQLQQQALLEYSQRNQQQQNDRRTPFHRPHQNSIATNHLQRDHQLLHQSIHYPVLIHEMPNRSQLQLQQQQQQELMQPLHDQLETDRRKRKKTLHPEIGNLFGFT